MAKQITDAQFNDEIQSDTLTLVDLWADWCMPCKMVSPVLDELANDYGDKIKVIKLNVDENQVTPTKFGVMGIPTILFFKNGKEVDRVVGAAPKSNFVSVVKKHL